MKLTREDIENIRQLQGIDLVASMEEALVFELRKEQYKRRLREIKKSINKK